MTDYKTLHVAEVSVGDKLPPLDIDITAGLVVGGAIATRDYEPVHHNKAAAQAAGLPDVFMNILTSQGLMERFATDWSGPEAVVKALDIQLGAPNVPGMVMTITGEVKTCRVVRCIQAGGRAADVPLVLPDLEKEEYAADDNRQQREDQQNRVDVRLRLLDKYAASAS